MRSCGPSPEEGGHFSPLQIVDADFKGRLAATRRLGADVGQGKLLKREPLICTAPVTASEYFASAFAMCGERHVGVKLGIGTVVDVSEIVGQDELRVILIKSDSLLQRNHFAERFVVCCGPRDQ